MPTQVQIPSTCPCLEQAPNWLPVKIPGTCPDVQGLDQFTSTNAALGAEEEPQQHVEQGNSVLEANLRGRKLRGCTMALPDGYRGFVLQRPYEDGEEQPFKPASEFKAVTYWNHDSSPSRLDPFRRALDWLSIAKQVHATISPQQVDEALRQAAATPVL